MLKKERKKYIKAIKKMLTLAEGDTKETLTELHDHILMGTLDYLPDAERDLDVWDTYLQRLLALRAGSETAGDYSAFSLAIVAAKVVNPELDRWN